MKVFRIYIDQEMCTTREMQYSLDFKRMFDLSACLIALPFLLPFFAITAIGIKLDSTGPVFYRGWRIGLGGKPFRICKFRTMVVDAEKIGGGTTALKDPRITRIGSFLRRYKFDELPQVLNVIKGDMSIVGPRPELLQYTRQYSDEERRILDVRPGLTDFSSIQFSSLDEMVGSKNADAVFEEKILDKKNKLRLKYVNERSFKVDLKLIVFTLWVIVKKGFKESQNPALFPD
jgi:lipopolysaccharide/colanic/teichoic acid biosynthesis glycosyltransferase